MKRPRLMIPPGGFCRRERAGALAAGSMLVALIILGAAAGAEIGVFKTVEWQQGSVPKGSITLRDLELEITIKGGFAETRMRQVFENHYQDTVMGSYYLKLPPETVLMDFGVWDDGNWTDAVVIEREQGKQAFAEIVQRMIDPALLEAPEAEITEAFQVSVAPIPAFGTRRVETAFHTWIPARSGRREFVLPLSSSPEMTAEKSDHLKISIKVRDACPLAPVAALGPSGMNLVTQQNAAPAADGTCSFEAGFDGGPVALDHDLKITVPLAGEKSRLSISTYRDARTERLDTSATGGQTYRDQSGYFLAEAYFRPGGEERNTEAAQGKSKAERDVVVLFDTSLSMQFEKLDKAAEVLAAVFSDLGPADRFTLAAMGREAAFWKKDPVPATETAKNSAMEFLRRTPLTGGTPLQQGLVSAIGAFEPGASGRRRQVIAITDGQATLDEIKEAAIVKAVEEKNRTADGGEICALYVFGLGDDVNAELLSELARGSGGSFIQARETEDIGAKIGSFLAALQGVAIRNLVPAFDPALGVDLVYPSLPLTAFDCESVSWVGRYAQPRRESPVKLTGSRGGEPVALTALAPFPEQAAENDYISRLWAERRVQALLGLIRDRGEEKDWVDEIVALSKRFKFPTPYTSYLVAPRAFLRPRVIRPRDPVLTVKAALGTRSIVALFPFGDVMPMRYVKTEDVWEARFIVPAWMKDGRYFCRLAITDQAGIMSMELKEFIVDSAPPRLTLKLKNDRLEPGQALELFVDADADTRRISAQLGALPAAAVRWDDQARVNRGSILVPGSLAPGEYTLRITAEDFAHNVTSMQKSIRIGG